jgi:3-hydroxyethyl bacteriochlorophyllide a dehydrogenase
MKAEAIIFPEANKVAYGPVELLEPEPGEALVRTLVTIVSTGTDTRTLRGNQTGGKFPLVPGYSSLGVVEEVRGEANVEPGDLVFAGGGKGFADVNRCWAAQCSYVVAPLGGLLPLDDRRSPAEYGFCKVAAIALHGVRRSFSGPADRVLVIGLGLIGQLHARIQAAMGREVIAADILPGRIERAVAAGVMRGVNAAEEELAEVVAGIWPDGPQVAVEATARQEGLDQCMALLRKRAWGGDDRMPVLVVQSSFVGRISFAYDAVFGAECLIVPTRDQDPRDLAAAAQMIGAGSLRVDDLITLRTRPQEAPAAFQELLEHPEKHVTIVFEWE